MSTKYGHPDLAIVPKSQDFAGYDPRGEKGIGLAYATSPIGASHMRGDPTYIEILGVPMLIDSMTWKDKSSLVRDWQDVFAVIDSAGIFVFFSVLNYVAPSRETKPEGILRPRTHLPAPTMTRKPFYRQGSVFLMPKGFFWFEPD